MKYFFIALTTVLLGNAISSEVHGNTTNCAQHEDPALQVPGLGRNLHAPPSVIGRIATETGAGKLVLSHFMARSLENLQDNVDEVRSRYSGPVIIAKDLGCTTFS